MNCHEIDDRLDDFVDGALDGAAAAAVGAHLAGCARCRDEEARLRRLLAHAAALPRAVAPPRDLWPGIQERLERRTGWSWDWGWGAPALAAAATVAVALVALLWNTPAPARVRTAEIPAASAMPALVAADAGAPDPVLVEAEREYEEAANALLEALQKRQTGVPPETLAAVRSNLEVIDRALVEVRHALAQNPSSPELNRMLVGTHRKKVDVLRRVVKLSTVI